MPPLEAIRPAALVPIYAAAGPSGKPRQVTEATTERMPVIRAAMRGRLCVASSSSLRKDADRMARVGDKVTLTVQVKHIQAGFAAEGAYRTPQHQPLR